MITAIRVISIACATLLAAAALSPGASAQPRTKPLPPWTRGVPKVKRDQALKHYRAGNEHFSRSLYAQALPDYEKAVALWSHPAFLYNLGVCQLHLKRPLEAQKSFTRALRFGPKPLGPGRGQLQQHHLATQRREWGGIAI